ncbi:Hypothetical protein ERGA_CDS_09380 [Ehrlichia ruminantium str. Gardel]|nr:Hypothetical protein ERGA_CDS_09380 [Ehrlichia ruminantium str. Gardel]
MNLPILIKCIVYYKMNSINNFNYLIKNYIKKENFTTIVINSYYLLIMIKHFYNDLYITLYNSFKILN